MRPPAAVAACTLTVLTALAGLAGCGSDESDKEPSMTPDEAFASTRSVVVAILHAVQPGAGGLPDDPDRNVPCGGLGGNEYTKVRADINARLRLVRPDLDQVSETVRGVLADAGWTATERTTNSPRLILSFGGDAGGGTLTLDPDGQGQLLVETICLPNPSSEDPFPDVKPRTSPS